MWSSSDASTYSSAPATSSRVSSSGRTHAIGDLVQHPALLVDHAARHGQGQHAQRVADALEHFALRSQLGRIAILLTQEQVERFLHAQQVVLQRARDRVEQGAVVPGHRSAGVLQFGGIGQQAVQRDKSCAAAPSAGCAAWPGPRCRAACGDLVRIAATQAVLAMLDQQADVAIDLADQLAHFSRLRA